MALFDVIHRGRFALRHSTAYLRKRLGLTRVMLCYYEKAELISPRRDPQSDYRASLEDLSGQMGVDVEAFMKTVEYDNALCVQGSSDDFNTPLDEILLVGPSYGELPITGLAVDDRMHVIDPDGKPVANSYAVGKRICGNWFEGGYPMSGTGLGGCVSSGRIATATLP